MSRILDALRKAVPPNPPKPLIFEKVSFDTPNSETVKREVESKKEYARLRYILNEPGARPALSNETRNFLWVTGALLAACLVAGFLWPRPESPVDSKRLAEESMRLHERVAQLESELAAKQDESSSLASVPVLPNPNSAAELESLRDEVKRLNRRLAVMLQDNLEKDQEIARLSSR